MEMGQTQNPDTTTSSPTATKLELTVDEAIEKHVGSLGLSQMLHVFLISLAWVFEAQTTLVTIFSDAQPSAWRCKHDIHHQNISSSCTTFAASSNGVGSVCGLEPGTWEWVGGHKSSVIAEFGLICDRKFLAAVPASLFFLGSLLGSAAYGHLADGWLGRKRTVLVSCIFTALTAYLTSLSPNIWVYAFIRLTSGFFRSGLGSCIVLATEVVGRKWRGQVGQYGFFLFTAGFLSLPFIAYPTRKNWRNLYRIIAALPLGYTIFLIPFVSESPRWLLVRGRGEEALEVLRQFARRNGRRLPENLSLLNPSSAKEMAEESLWRTKWAAKRMMIIMLSGFGVGFVYYGIQLNVENLDFNLYFTVGVNALMEIPAVLLGSIMLALMNRRLVFSLSAYIAGASCLLCILFSHQKKAAADGTKLKSGGSWLQLLTEGVGFMAISIAFDVMYIYCVELFPTNVRNFAMAMLRQSLMLGASVAPLLVAVGRMSPALSFLVFGVLSIFSGILTIWLPETRNAPLYDTLKEQEEEEKASRGSELELGN